jgi:hypothetical protein
MKAAEAAVVALGTAATAGCVVGRHLGLSPRGLPRVAFEGCPDGQEARTVCTEFASPTGVATGRELLLQFEGGDPRRPVVVGLMQPPVVAVRTDDGAVLTLRAERRIELVCGKASIVLCADGKVVLKGANLISRSSGPNKIRGASVDIN